MPASKAAAPSRPAPKPRPAPRGPSPAQSRVTAMLEDIKQRGDQISAEISALLVRLK